MSNENQKPASVRIANFTPHPSQQIVLDCPKRFRIIEAGRQWGKTMICQVVCMVGVLEKPGAVWAWMSPTLRQAKKVFRNVRKALQEAGLVNAANAQDLFIELKNGSYWHFWSGESADNVRGETLDGLVIDEAALIEESVWQEVLLPMLSVRNGRAMIISTPRGARNWFCRLCNKAKKDPDGPYAYFHFSSMDSPYNGREFIKMARGEMSESRFRQEIMAEQLDEGAGVFSRVDNCIINEYRKSHPNLYTRYMGALDIASRHDYTVLLVADLDNKEIVDFYRFQMGDYTDQEILIKSVYDKYAFRTPDGKNKGYFKIWGDATKHDAFTSRLRALGVNIQDVVFNSMNKTEMVESLRLSIEQGNLRWKSGGEFDKHFRMEAETFDMTILPASGKIRYGAASGFHDDVIIAAAILNNALQNHGGVSKGTNAKIFRPRTFSDPLRGNDQW
jgi:hypothetical protein